MIAIATHTTGALGKLFSEVAENADLKPVEGLASSGASRRRRMWFGVIPPVAPVILSQLLCYRESNTPLSTVIGALSAAASACV
jgi:phosphonate transport system permease protein